GVPLSGARRFADAPGTSLYCRLRKMMKSRRASAKAAPRRAGPPETGPPSSQPMREALLLSLKQGKPIKRPQAIANKLVGSALRGDFYGIREIFGRIDGPLASHLLEPKVGRTKRR